MTAMASAGSAAMQCSSLISVAHLCNHPRRKEAQSSENSANENSVSDIINGYQREAI